MANALYGLDCKARVEALRAAVQYPALTEAYQDDAVATATASWLRASDYAALTEGWAAYNAAVASMGRDLDLVRRCHEHAEVLALLQAVGVDYETYMGLHVDGAAAVSVAVNGRVVACVVNAACTTRTVVQLDLDLASQGAAQRAAAARAAAELSDRAERRFAAVVAAAIVALVLCVAAYHRLAR
jgi:hypothetical protein